MLTCCSILAYLAGERRDHRRELGLLLATRLMRDAAQDWYEQGDIWTQVAAYTGQDQLKPSRPRPPWRPYAT